MNPIALAAGSQAYRKPLGSVPGARVIGDSANDFRIMDERDVVLPANTPTPQAAAGDYIVIQATSAPFSYPMGERSLAMPNGFFEVLNNTKNASDGFILVRTDNGDQVRLDAVGKGYVFPRPYKNLFFTYVPASYVGSNQNGQGNTVTIRIYAGFGRLQNDTGVRAIVGLQAPAGARISRGVSVVAYAANQIVTSNGGILPVFCNMARFPGGGGVITRALMTKGPNLVNADFTLWLFNAGSFQSGITFQTIADYSSYVCGFTDNGADLLGMIRFNNFITGGGGSIKSVNDVSGISIPYVTDNANINLNVGLTAANGSQPVGPGQIVGFLVTNAAYVPDASEVINLKLFADLY